MDDNETIDIGGNRTETVHKSEQITIKGNRDKTVNGNDTLTVNKDRKETVNKSRSLKVDKNNTELVKMAKSMTVGLAYATQVGTVMNTAVGIMQTEQVGRIKKTLVGKSYSISVGNKFEISVGSSKITMTEDSISITAKTILVAAENKNVIIGKDVLINPPGAIDGGGSEESSSGVSFDDSKLSGVVGGGFGGGAGGLAKPDYLDDDEAEIDPDGLPMLGSDSDDYESNVAVDNYDKDGNLLGSHDLEDSPSGLLAFSSTKGLKRDSTKEIDPFEPVYVDPEEDNWFEAGLKKIHDGARKIQDGADDFFFGNDKKTNATDTARNAAMTGARLPDTGTMAVGDTLLGAGPSAYGGFDTELRRDYDYFVREGRLPDKPGASAFPPYAKARQRINKELIEKHKGAGWTELGKDGRSPQNDIWGKK